MYLCPAVPRVGRGGAVGHWGEAVAGSYGCRAQKAWASGWRQQGNSRLDNHLGRGRRGAYVNHQRWKKKHSVQKLRKKIGTQLGIEPRTLVTCSHPLRPRISIVVCKAERLHCRVNSAATPSVKTTHVSFRFCIALQRYMYASVKSTHPK